MNQETNQQVTTFSDYIYILFKWKKFIIITIIFLSLITLGVLFLFPNQYKAKSVIMLPPESNLGISGLTGLLSGKTSASSAGSKLFGLTSGDQDVLLAILYSRTSLTDAIDKFNLFDYYNISKKNYDKTIKAFSNDVAFEPTEYGMIEISVINKDPKLASDIANYFAKLVDSINIVLNTQSATNNRIFIERRYLKNLADLKKAEDILFNFQKKYGIVAVPEQLEVTVKAAAEIESELMKKEMEEYFIKQLYGENSIQHQGILTEIKMLKNKIQELKSSTDLSSSSNILFPFKEMPNIAIEYLRAFREVKIQESVLEIVMPMYEQSKVEEQKSIPTIMVLDKAVPPQVKYSPKRATITIIVAFLLFFILLPIVFIGEKALTRTVHKNSLELAEFKFYSKLKRIYRLKF